LGVIHNWSCFLEKPGWFWKNICIAESGSKFETPLVVLHDPRREGCFAECVSTREWGTLGIEKIPKYPGTFCSSNVAIEQDNAKSKNVENDLRARPQMDVIDVGVYESVSEVVLENSV